MQELIKKIEQWATSRQVHNTETVEGQSIKTAEKIAELIKGISKDNIDSIKDGIGDVFVTLVIGNMLDRNIDMEECCTEAEESFKMYLNKNKKNVINHLAQDITKIIKNGYYEHSLYHGLVDLITIAYVYNLNFKDCVESGYFVLENTKMDRDIKFRIWHKETKIMYKVAQIDFYNERVGYLFVDPISQSQVIGYADFSDIELMQFTGFEDSNYIEIYEGDIVQSYMGYERGILEGIVEFIDGCYFVKDVPLTDLTTIIQVVGNKYEYKNC